jgi:hypothetical protein
VVRAVALLLAACPAAFAQPKPVSLAMNYEVGENIHIANQGGAINRHMKIELRVQLEANGKVIATDKGTSREHNLYNNWSTDDDQTWTVNWRGTYKQTGDTLALDLVLVDRKCKHTKASTGAPIETLPCRDVSKQIHFDCKSTQVAMPGPINANGVKPSRDAWQCQAPHTAELDFTPRTWTLGKTSCIKVLGGRGGTHYDAC